MDGTIPEEKTDVKSTRQPAENGKPTLLNLPK